MDFEIDNIELDTYKTISITDNGTGIEYEKLSQKFKNFLDSGKAKMVVGNDNDIVRGKMDMDVLLFSNLLNAQNGLLHIIQKINQKLIV